MEKKLIKNIITQLLIFLLFIILSFVINKIPQGSFVAGGDFYQVINPENNYGRYFYTWINQNGQGSFNPLFVTYPFYLIIGMMGLLGASSSFIAGIYLFIILYFSYLSFFLGIRYIVPNISKEIRIFLSLIYALNNFTVTIFTHSWGFNHHFLIYAALPLLIGIFHKILFSKKIELRYLVILMMILSVGFMVFNNLAFVFLIFFIYILIIILGLVFKQLKLDKNLIKKGLYVLLIYSFLLFCISKPINYITFS